MKILKGDCLEIMKQIPDKSIDAIITDQPYGTTQCKWDSVIDFDLMWEQLNRIIKPNGAIVLFGSQPFTSALVSSNYKMFKYSLVWEKDKASNFMLAKKQIQKYHEDICIFYDKQCTYNPIKWDAGKKANIGGKGASKLKKGGFTGNAEIGNYIPNTNLRYPKSIIKVNTPKANDKHNNCLHPTQKPIALMEYLIKTYTNENETVLDFTMGSGSTGVACVNTNRNFIGIEQDDKYFEIAKQRIFK